jgi:molybdopterin converting factor small subunit
LVITVKLHNVLQMVSASGRTSWMSLELAEGSVVGDALKALDIRWDPDNLVLGVNREQADPEKTLKNGDTLDIIPAVSGGSREPGEPVTTTDGYYARLITDQSISW